ncbi:MAG: dihydrofolate reductase [Myxococcales bacterium]|nr:dihydrofolate reductase [Myxococcales bacterium]
MRRLRVFESISVDGYFADAGGGMEWAHATPPDPAFDAWVSANASSGGELLFGRVTYEMMAAFWPTPLAAEQMPEVAAGMNAAVKWVATRTLTPSWANARRLEGELAAAVRALKESAGPDVTVLGSGSVAAALGAAGLVDEYQLVIVPVALGAGRSLFTSRAALRLVDQRAFANGKVVVTYAAA